MFIEISQTWYATDHICWFIHHNHSCCPKTSSGLNQTVKIHQYLLRLSKNKTQIQIRHIKNLFLYQSLLQAVTFLSLWLNVRHLPDCYTIGLWKCFVKYNQKRVLYCFHAIVLWYTITDQIIRFCVYICLKKKKKLVWTYCLFSKFF